MRRLVLVLVMLLAGCGGTTQSGPIIAADKRAAAPDVRGEMLGGGTFDLAAHKGDVVVINFWASNCPPCRCITINAQLR